MPVQTGTATPWREIGHSPPKSGGRLAYFRPGTVSGSADLLAEQMRADGTVRSLGPAIRLASEADLRLGWYGFDEDSGEDTLCDEDGWTAGGSEVDEPRRCVLAFVDASEL